MSKTMTSKNELEVALRIQKRMLAEARQELIDIQTKMNQKTKDMDEQMIKLSSEVKQKACEIREKQIHIEHQDHSIKMLQQRVTNLNVEFNSKLLSQGIYKPQAPDLPPGDTPH